MDRVYSLSIYLFIALAGQASLLLAHKSDTKCAVISVSIPWDNDSSLCRLQL